MIYPDVLNAAWAAHQAPKAADAPTVVSTFAGCGGSSLGYSMAGYRELLAVEWEEHAAAVFSMNFPEIPVHVGDIAKVDPAVLGLGVGELDVLDGSPPCQGFSTAGLRNLDDPRNQLFREFVRLLTAWQPKVFVMENVTGLVKGSARPIFVEILAELKAAGYRVIVRMLDASLLGVPQARKRMIFVGVRNDLGLDPVHPKPRYPVVTVRQAFAYMNDMSARRAYFGSETFKFTLAGAIGQGEGGNKVLERVGKKGNYFSLIRLGWDKPSGTVCKNSTMLHPEKARLITAAETARLQSFPDQFQWGSASHMKITARIGNSVPPLMMRAIAETIRTEILDAL